MLPGFPAAIPYRQSSAYAAVIVVLTSRWRRGTALRPFCLLLTHGTGLQMPAQLQARLVSELS